MSVMTILQRPHHILRARADDIVAVTPDVRQLADDMAETMYAYNGVGLAGPQVGALLRIIVIDPTTGEVPGQLVVMVNPVITWDSKDMYTDTEGCLSVPGVLAHVVRSDQVEVTYLDLDNLVQRRRYDGIMARIVQHEIDHLDGVLVTDRDRFARQRSRR